MNYQETDKEKQAPAVGAFGIVFVFVVILAAIFSSGDKGESQSGNPSKPSSNLLMVRNNITTVDIPACLTKTDYDDFSGMMARNDSAGINYLMKSSRCIMLKSGVRISVIERHIWSATKIRVYAGNDALDLWTAYEFVVEKP